MHPERGPGRSGPDLDQIAYLVHQVKAMAAAIRATPDPAGERISDPSLVVHLAEDFVPVEPYPERAARTGVVEGVRGDLAGRENQVCDPVRAERGAASVTFHQPPNGRQVRVVGQALGAGGRGAQQPGTVRRGLPR